MEPEDSSVINRLPDLKLLSCGYEHAAVIRNNCVYTMGVATSGCLGKCYVYYITIVFYTRKVACQ